MPSNPVDESAAAKALRLRNSGERVKKILALQGRGLWHGDLSEMRRDQQALPADKNTDAAKRK